MPRRRAPGALIACCALAALAACGPRRIELPAGDGSPFPGAAEAYQQATGECRNARTIQATLRLSGRAGSTNIRGTVDAGFEAPASVRLEGRHPLGRPVFILVAGGGPSTLYLPRDDRVLRGAETSAIVEALVGLRLDAGELRAIVAGCGLGAADPVQGRTYPGGWAAVDTAGGTTYLRQIDGRWRIAAAARPPLVVQYGGFVLGRAGTLRLQASGATGADLTVRLSDVNINVALHPDTFAVDVPSSAVPLTLDELREAGPLGER
jgi:hypothetical protein